MSPEKKKLSIQSDRPSTFTLIITTSIILIKKLKLSENVLRNVALQTWQGPTLWLMSFPFTQTAPPFKKDSGRHAEAPLSQHLRLILTDIAAGRGF